MAKDLFEDYGSRPDDLLDARAAWAAASVMAGGDPAAAIAVSEGAYRDLRHDQTLLDRWNYAYLVYLSHATVLRAAGRAEDAEAVLGEATALCEGRNDIPALAYVRLRLSEIYLARGETERARVLLERTLPVFVETRQRNHLAEAHGYLEEIYADAPGGLAAALRHARAARDLRYELLEGSRLESLVALQRDYRATQAEHRARLAEEAAARAELERASAASQRTASLLGGACVVGLLAFALRQLRERRRHSRTLEAEVAERTAELQTKTARLEASNEELERFAYIASHDLKTPLRNVTSFLGLIERRMPDDGAPRPSGSTSTSPAATPASMHQLVTDVLEFSRLNADLEELCQVTDVRALCVEVVGQREGAIAEAGAEVAVLGAARLLVPPAFLAQVVGNLLDNGLKYNQSPTPRVTVELIDGRDELRIRVRDNGIGIAPEYHDRVFELFKRLHTSDAYTGTGLGLSTCRKIARRLGGDITVESAEAAGSVFEVRLPKRTPGRAPGQGAGAAAARRTVLA